MKRGLRIITIACVLLAGGVAGCGGGKVRSGTDAQATARLRQLLAKEPRLPDGFSTRPDQAWRMPFKPHDRNCRTVLQAAGGGAPKRALTAQAAASYQGDGLGEQAAVGLAQYAGSEASDHIDDLSRALDACRTVRAGDGTDLTLRELPMKDVGDETVAAELRGRLNGYPYALDVVLARSGDTLVSIVHTGLSTVDSHRTRQLLNAVVGMASA
ncbi:hypothetical protein ABT294_12915 [Nonomuraea sp. NPDC000554]|uniref:hypothetical protein n=1 Tax=Nonomuraea sp. NPDC000554 TaxID=3154259 RepID=UPI00332BA818